MNAEQGGWFLHNLERKGKGLQPEALDKDSPVHIQIITDYAQQHAAKFAAPCYPSPASCPDRLHPGLESMACHSDRLGSSFAFSLQLHRVEPFIERV